MTLRTTQQPPRILVVGGNGFVGKHIVSHAVSLGWSVTSLSLRSAVPSLQPGVRMLAADASDRVALGELLGNAEFEYVVNCGGYIDHSLFFKGGRRVFDSHLGIVVNLVETLNRDALQSLVNIGSSDEYGSNPAPQIEAQREAPITPYATGKVAATHFLQMLHRTEGFPATTLRLFLTYGPGQDTRRFLPQIILGCLQGGSFPVSQGEQLRDFCFIRDTIDAVFAALVKPAAHGEVINIASGQPVSIRQMIETVKRMIGRGQPRFGEVPYRAGENMELYAGISKAQALLAWKPKVILEDGLDETVRRFRNTA